MPNVTVPQPDTVLVDSETYSAELHFGQGDPCIILRNYIRSHADQYGFVRRMDLLPLREMLNIVILFDVVDEILLLPCDADRARIALADLNRFLAEATGLQFRLS